MTDAYTNAFGGTSSTVKLDNTWGGVIKFGVEFPIDENWVFDIGYSRYWIKNKATITTDTPGMGEIERTIKAQANPDAFGLLIGYKL
ncbi:OmpW family protein [compost metagenome]